jgi:UDP-glucose 4-epimerase
MNSLNDSIIFISGGAGFIGSHLVDSLLMKNKTGEVVVYDNFTSGQKRHLSRHAGNRQLRVVEGDIKDLKKLTEAMAGCAVVFHLAANPDISKAVTQPDIDFWEGTFLTQNVLEAMRLNKIKKIFYTSGSGVYGEDPQTQFAEDYGPCFPISTYGASKLASEALICSYCYMFDMVGRAFRFANVVGPRQTHGVGYDFIRRLKQDPTRLRILGDGTQTKAYIYVDDVLDAIFIVSEKCKEKFDVFNVATDDYITVKEIAELAVAESGLDTSLVRFECTGGDRGWKGDVPVVLFNATKIKSLGWRAKRSSKEAVRDAIKAMKGEIGQCV